MDAQQVGHLTSAILAPAAPHAPGLGEAQTGDQVYNQLSHGHGVDAGVESFVRDGRLGSWGQMSLSVPVICECDHPWERKVPKDAEEDGVGGQLGALAAYEAGVPGTQASAVVVLVSSV